MAGKVKNFNHNLWYSENEGIITIGINEEGLEDITEINAIDLPPEQEKVDADTAFGSLETDDGTIEILLLSKALLLKSIIKLSMTLQF